MMELCSLVVAPRVGYDDRESSGLDSVSPGASAKNGVPGWTGRRCQQHRDTPAGRLAVLHPGTWSPRRWRRTSSDTVYIARRGEAVNVVERLLERALEKEALKYGEFILSSGQRSRYYFDGRLLSLDPEGSYLLGKALLPKVREANVDAVGGPTLGADPVVSAVALTSHIEGTPVPAFIVRGDAKSSRHSTADRRASGPRQQGDHHRRRVLHGWEPVPRHRGGGGSGLQGREGYRRARPPPGGQR